MGKKRVVKKTGEELLEEREIVQQGISRQTSGKQTKRVQYGRVYIYSSYNNTLMSMTDPRGNVLAQVSAGKIGFKGARKATPYAASRVAEAITQLIENRNIGSIDIYVKGVGPGRDSALRTLSAKGFDVASIHDVTPVPHNGPRPKKPRRV